MGSRSIQPEIDRILEGDREAIAWLYDRFAPRLMRRLGQRFGESQGLDSGDLLHDTFVYLLNHQGRVLKRFSDTSKELSEAALGRFLWSCACGIASNRRRSVIRHPASDFDDEQEHPSVPQVEGPAIARDLLERLARCVWGRGERAYLYFQLRYRGGLTPAEVAAATGWSQRSTYKQKQRLDRALELCIEELGLEES